MRSCWCTTRRGRAWRRRTSPRCWRRCAGTEPRERLWRALTPQAFRRGELAAALRDAAATGVVATDEAMAFERLGRYPRLVEGRDDNLKVTTPADLAVAETLLARRAGDGAYA